MSPSGLVLVMLAAQAGPRLQIDPALSDELKPIVKQAVEAELDKNRGPVNAKKILEAEFTTRKPGTPDELTLRLRHAAVEMRRHHLKNHEAPEAIRYEQAVATFARLDLRDPGLKAWLAVALAHHPYAQKKLAKKSQRTLEATVLVRGTDVDQKDFVKRLQHTLRGIGYDLRIVPAKKASLIIKLGAESAAAPDKDSRAVRIDMGMESVRNGKTIWRHSLHRTEAAKDVEVAKDAAMTWLVNVGGRDLFFRWLGERAFHSLLERGRFGVAVGHDHEREHQDEKPQQLFGNPPLPSPGRH